MYFSSYAYRHRAELWSRHSPLADNCTLDVVVEHLAQLILRLAKAQVLELFFERGRFGRTALCIRYHLGWRCKVVGQGGNGELARLYYFGENAVVSCVHHCESTCGMDDAHPSTC